ncbi:MAG: hypothetical protein ABI051_08330 [Vicinamibacterales bacterium]
MCRRLALAAVLAATVACSAPDKELHQAEGAIAAARAADAAVYAPEELKAAESALQKYDGSVAQRDYRLALRLALEARDTAYEAARRAADERAIARGQAERLMSDLTSLIDQAAERQTGPGAIKSPATLTRLRAASSSATTHLQEARTLLQQQNFRAVTADLQPIIDSLRAELVDAAPAPARRER